MENIDVDILREEAVDDRIDIPTGHWIIKKRETFNTPTHLYLPEGSVLYCSDDVGLYFAEGAVGSVIEGKGKIVGLEGCRYPVWFHGAKRSSVKDVTIEVRDVDAKQGLCLAACSRMVVDSVTLIGPKPAPYDDQLHRYSSRQPAGILLRTDGELHSAFILQNCIVSGFGIGILTGTVERLTIRDCIVNNTSGQHGMYLSSTTDTVVANNVINGSALQGIKLQCADKDGRDAGRAIVQGNLLTGIKSHGILITSTGNREHTYKDCIVMNNTILGHKPEEGECAAIRVLTKDDDSILIKGNTSLGFARHLLHTGFDGGTFSNIETLEPQGNT